MVPLAAATAPAAPATQVVFTSRRSVDILTRCWEATLSLIWPLRWMLVYVPYLPDPLSEYRLHVIMIMIRTTLWID
eukprot:COSAG01_NODE_622_length_14779_cov_69.589305_13_plen_76_part_00